MIIKFQCHGQSTLQKKVPWLHSPGLGKTNQAFLQHFKAGDLKRSLDLKGVRVIHVNLVLCGSAKIKSLNSQYRNKKKVTDVLSFPIFESLRAGHKEHPLPSHLALGDIYICLPMAIKQAKSFSLGLEQELIHLYTHGLLHLLGFDHEISLREEKRMQALESKLVGTAYSKNNFKNKRETP